MLCSFPCPSVIHLHSGLLGLPVIHYTWSSHFPYGHHWFLSQFHPRQPIVMSGEYLFVIRSIGNADMQDQTQAISIQSTCLQFYCGLLYLAEFSRVS